MGLRLLKEYVTRIRQARDDDGKPTYERVLLIAHEELIPFYEKGGFEHVGESSVVHGSRPWHEMRLVF